MISFNRDENTVAAKPDCINRKSLARWIPNDDSVFTLT